MKSLAVWLSVPVLVQTLLLAVPSRTQEKQDSPRRLAIRAGRLIDGKSKDPIVNAVILVENDKITAVGSALAIPPGTAASRTMTASGS